MNELLRIKCIPPYESTVQYQRTAQLNISQTTQAHNQATNIPAVNDLKCIGLPPFANETY